MYNRRQLDEQLNCYLLTHFRDPTFSGAPELFNDLNVILKEYGNEHQIAREDLSIVYATLNAEDYVLFVSHAHDECTFVFDVYNKRVPGQRWGKVSLHFWKNPLSVFSALNARYKVSDVRHEDESKVRPERGDTLMLLRFGFEQGRKDPVTLVQGW